MNYLSVYSHVDSNGSFIKLSFNLGGRSYNLRRVSTESVAKTLKRISISISKATTKPEEGKKNQRGKSEDARHIPITLFHQNGDVVNGEMSNFEAWSEGNVLEVADCKFFVEKNTPLVQSASIPSVIMAGFPVVPTLKLEFSDEFNSQYEWFKQKLSVSAQESSVIRLRESDGNTSDTDWVKVGEEFVYVPTVEDVGCLLKMSCKAASAERKAHIWYSVISSFCVSASPGPTPFEARQLYTSVPISDPSAFRVVSYNILADCYLEDEATCEAWFGYCPKYALAIDYRQQLLLKELQGYNGDIICLQECGRRLFENYLTPAMKFSGYTGVAFYKAGVMAEGEALFFKDSRFNLISQKDIILKDYFLNDPCNSDLLQRVKLAPDLLEKLSSRTTVAQLVVLQCTDHPCDYICLVNTHLYFRPSAPFIRNLQAMTLLNCLNQTLRKLDMELRKSSSKEYNIGILFCGDFNSLPQSGMVQLMCTGVLEGNHPDWILPKEAGQSASNFEMSTYSHPFGFQNCCGLPKFTTYTEGFKGVIDYIFATEKTFEIQAVIPMPSVEELQAYTAVPSPVVPSDHLALICELKWQKC